MELGTQIGGPRFLMPRQSRGVRFANGVQRCRFQRSMFGSSVAWCVHLWRILNRRFATMARWLRFVIFKLELRRFLLQILKMSDPWQLWTLFKEASASVTRLRSVSQHRWVRCEKLLDLIQELYAELQAVKWFALIAHLQRLYGASGGVVLPDFLGMVVLPCPSFSIASSAATERWRWWFFCRLSGSKKSDPGEFGGQEMGRFPIVVNGQHMSESYQYLQQ